eukprot:CAMPEP_0182867118 /NCGR_PEP_ID=MMETSP0034_2-20130328/8551_1 /TAXON_ID=156128 /ORGANISM="Nephroselmis pyriformis, Strain CCMP717" /LENGTH=164 /DNA_ID=CAMNT_0024999457 /DNA_START=305 /DNA_END=799 /DNA_ORIENTATION=-
MTSAWPAPPSPSISFAASLQPSSVAICASVKWRPPCLVNLSMTYGYLARVCITRIFFTMERALYSSREATLQSGTRISRATKLKSSYMSTMFASSTFSHSPFTTPVDARGRGADCATGMCEGPAPVGEIAWPPLPMIVLRYALLVRRPWVVVSARSVGSLVERF